MRLFTSLSFATCAVVALNGPRQDPPVALAHPQVSIDSTANNLRVLKVDSFGSSSRRLAGKEGSRSMGRSEIVGRKYGGRAGGVVGAIGGGALGAAGGVVVGADTGTVATPIGTVVGGVAGGISGANFGGRAGLSAGKQAGASMGGKFGRQFDKRRNKKNAKKFEATNPQQPARLTRRHSSKFLL
ncbi:hypothetical protein AC1031_011441 [Aphanomyces cochlioides]|nr:hypothetical protein AC1031_011441 [Aphanomyces cochlioides]